MELEMCQLYAEGCTNGGTGASRYQYYSMKNCNFNTDCLWSSKIGKIIDAKATDPSGNSFEETYLDENFAKKKCAELNKQGLTNIKNDRRFDFSRIYFTLNLLLIIFAKSYFLNCICG